MQQQTYIKISIPNNLFLEIAPEYRSLLAKFIIYKRAFKNSIIYNYNSHRAHAMGRLPYSLHALVNHIKLFKQRGWVQETKEGHLFFIPLEKLAKAEGIGSDLTKKLKVVIRQGDNHINVLSQLYALSLQDKGKQTLYAIAEATCNQAPTRGYKTEISFQCSLSALGKYWNVSKTSAHTIINSLFDMGFIETEIKDELVGKIDKLPRHMRLKGYFMSGKGYLMKRQPTRITILFVSMMEMFQDHQKAVSNITDCI